MKNVYDAIALGIRADSPIFGVGADLKSRFCIMNRETVYISEPIGNLSEEGQLDSLEKEVVRITESLGIQPEIVAHDLHPDYLSALWAKDYFKNKIFMPVQHHHAHIASVMAEHRLEGPVIGVAWDGFGLGLDMTAWGGEFLIVEGAHFVRSGHLRTFPLLGGDKAVHEIWRTAFSLITEAMGSNAAKAWLPERYQSSRRDLEKILRDPSFSPPCSSVGRLFDAASALLRLRENVFFEGEAAMELEKMASSELDSVLQNYPIEIFEEEDGFVWDPSPLLRAMARDAESGTPKPVIAAKFHRTLVSSLIAMVERIAAKTGIQRVALTGGCFQNHLLARWSKIGLSDAGFKVFSNERVPVHDGGIALGQCWIAAKKGGD